MTIAVMLVIKEAKIPIISIISDGSKVTHIMQFLSSFDRKVIPDHKIRKKRTNFKEVRKC